MKDMLIAIYNSLETKYKTETDTSDSLDKSMAHQLYVLAGYLTFMIYFIDPISTLKGDILLITSLKWLYYLYIFFSFTTAIALFLQVDIFIRTKKLSALSDYEMKVSEQTSTSRKTIKYIKDKIQMLSFANNCNKVYNELKMKWVRRTWASIIATGLLLLSFLAIYLIVKSR